MVRREFYGLNFSLKIEKRLWSLTLESFYFACFLFLPKYIYLDFFYFVKLLKTMGKIRFFSLIFGFLILISSFAFAQEFETIWEATKSYPQSGYDKAGRQYVVDYYREPTLWLLEHYLDKGNLHSGAIAQLNFPEAAQKIQFLYSFLKDNHFFKFFSEVLRDKKYNVSFGNAEYQKVLSELAEQEPQNVLQKVIFSYVNPKYAEEGSGLYLVPLKDGIFQAGTWQAKGKLILKEKTRNFTFPPYRLFNEEKKFFQVYFQLEENPENQLVQLPYVKNNEVLLGCIDEFSSYGQLRMILWISHYFDLVKSWQSYTGSRFSDQRYDFTIHNSDKQRLNFVPYLDTLISMRFYLLPNYLPFTENNENECSNSWLDTFDVLDV